MLRPAFMPDPGVQFQVDCQMEALVTEIIPSGTAAPDSAGFVALTLAQQPAAGTLVIQWATARQVSNTSGGQQTAASTSKSSYAASDTVAAVDRPSWYQPGTGVLAPGDQGGINWPRSDV